MATCGYFDDGSYGLFDSAIFDCEIISNIPNKVETSQSEIITANTSKSELNKAVTSKSELITSTISSSE